MVAVDSSASGARRLTRVHVEANDVVFESRGLRLAGTLTMPTGAGRFPAVLMIPGSGPLTRRTSRYVGDWLTAHGFVVFSYDKPGTGASGGRLGVLGHDDWSRDAVAALEVLARHPRVDVGRLGVMATSEGGFIAPRVARADARVSFVLCRVCSALPHLEAILDIEDDRLRRGGATDVERRDAMRFLRWRGEAALGARTPEAEAELERQLEGRSWRRHYQPSQLEVPPASAPYWAAFRSLLEGDPTSIYPERTLRVHYLWGADDARVRQPRHAEAIERLGARLGGVSSRILPCADHSLLSACSASGIAGFAPEAHREILAWLKQAAR